MERLTRDQIYKLEDGGLAQHLILLNCRTLLRRTHAERVATLVRPRRPARLRRLRSTDVETTPELSSVALRRHG